MVLVEKIMLVCNVCDYYQKKYYPKSSEAQPGAFKSVNILEPQPGDLIEIKRGYLLNHWAVYCDKGYAIHLINENLNNSYPVYSQPVIKVEEKLEDVAGNYLCRINNLTKEAKERDLKARPVHEVLQSAHNDLDKECPYSFFRNNGEHHVTHWKYGQPFSEGLMYYRNAAPIAIAGASTIYNFQWSGLTPILKWVQQQTSSSKMKDEKDEK